MKLGIVENVLGPGTERERFARAARMGLAGVELRLVTDPELVRPVDSPVVRGDPSLLFETTGWSPRIPLEATLRDVLRHLDEEAAQPPGVTI